MDKKISPRNLLLVLTGLNLLNYVDRYVLAAVRTPLAADLGIGYGDSGRLFTAFMVGYFLAAPFFGYLGDRVSRKGLIVLGVFVWSLGTALSGLAGGFGAMLFYRVLVGVGEASYAAISPSLISDSFGPSKRNNALTLFYAAIPLGAAIGYLFGGLVAAQWGWRQAFLWAGAPGLLLALALLPFKEPQRGAAEDISHQNWVKPGWREILGLFKNVDYNLVIGGYVAYTFALGAFAFWGPTFLEKVHGLTTARANGFFGGVLVAAGLLGTLLGGLAATAWRKRSASGYAWLLGMSMLAALPVSFMALLTSNRVMAMGFLAAAIFLLFLCTGPVNTLILETVPVNVRASAMAFSIFMIHLFGDMWSPEIVGRLADRLGQDLQKAVLILPVFLLVAAMFWLSLALKTKEPTPREGAPI